MPNDVILEQMDYGTSGGMNDSASRIEAIKDSGTSLGEYSYLGLSSVVKVDYMTPSIRYQLYDPSLASNIYTGLDRFGRVVNSRWYNHSSSTDTDRIKYGYGRASNRVWREDTVAASGSKYFDELYFYDGLYRLEDMQRDRDARKGTLSWTDNFRAIKHSPAKQRQRVVRGRSAGRYRRVAVPAKLPC